MSDYKKTIIFPIEIESREMLSKCLLALKCIENDYRVYFVTLESTDLLYDRINSCIFFHKSTWEKKLDDIKTRLGAKFVFMDEEAGLAMPKSKIKRFCEYRYRTVNAEKYDGMFVIGKKYHDIINELPNCENLDVYDCGWPRIDLWREKFNSLFEKKVFDIHKKHGDYYLFISSFGMTNEDDYIKRIKTSYTEFQKNIRQNRYNNFLNYLSLIKQLSNKLGEYEKLIIRPHPSERIHDWQEITKNLSNIYVERDGDITPWLLASKSILSCGSTVNVQAALQGKNVVHYQIKNIKGITDSPIYDVAKNASTVGKVLEYLRKENKSSISSLNDDAASLKYDVSSLEGKLASDKIVDKLNNYDIQPQKEITIPFLKKHRFKHQLRKLKYSFLNKLPFSKYKRIPPSMRKMPNGIKLYTIQENLNLLCGAQNINTENIKCLQVGSDIVSVEKKQ